MRKRFTKDTPLKEKLYSQTIRAGDCLEWTAGTQSDGYGSINIPDASKKSGWRSVLTHRLSFELSVGPIPVDMYVCHQCDNVLCIEPTHLFLGTQADNVEDCAIKGRRNQSRSRKLNRQQVQEIIELRNAGHGCMAHRQNPKYLSQKAIGELYGVTQATISAIMKEKIWR